jgi:S1-C subfamily serine protease
VCDMRWQRRLLVIAQRLRELPRFAVKAGQMRIVCCVLGLLFALAFSGQAPAQPQAKEPQISAALTGGFTGPVVFNLVRKSIAVITTDAGKQGSAVSIASAPGQGSMFATNCHVLTGATAFRVRTDSAQVEGTFVGGNVGEDACVFFANVDTTVPEMLNALDVLPGERVYAVGAPRGLEFSISEGIISARRGSMYDMPILLQTTAPISPGSSGGGLFDARGRLIGITSFNLKDSQNLNFAIAINMFPALMNKSEVRSLDELTKRTRGKDARSKGSR